ncbi:GFA family protein [Parerythrobacter jejuensis]
MKGVLKGGCLCGRVEYTIAEGFRLNPYACHCTDCQTRTGSAFSEHMLFFLKDIEINSELDVAEYTQPSGSASTIYGCPRCKARIYAENDSRPGMASLRCGTLTGSSSVIPAAHIWVQSKQPWLHLPENARTMEGNPSSSQEWVELVGIASQ